MIFCFSLEFKYEISFKCNRLTIQIGMRIAFLYSDFISTLKDIGLLQVKFLVFRRLLNFKD